MTRTRIRTCTAEQDARRDALQASLRRFLDAKVQELPEPPIGGTVVR